MSVTELGLRFPHFHLNLVGSCNDFVIFEIRSGLGTTRLYKRIAV